MQSLRASVTHLAFALFALSSTAFPQHAGESRQHAPLPPTNEVKMAPPTPLNRRAGRGLFYDEREPDGGVWVRGENFKAHFASDGATFVPFFGSQAPRNFELHLALKKVTVDGTPIALADSARVQRSGDRVTLDRGAVDEVYELGTRSMEQLFVLDGVPASGEIVLQVSIDTELSRSLASDGFEFANEFGRVRCGRATAIDAAGRSLALESELAAGAMTIRVPASFAANAALPIVVDPLWFTVDLETSTTVTLNPDVCHPNGGYLCVCWEEVFSATDHDVLCSLVDGGGGYYIGVYVDVTTEHWVRPRCAHLGAGDRVLVAAAVGQVGTRAVWGRAIQVGNPYAPVMSAKVELSDPSLPGEKYNADVGGDPFPSAPSYFCVVYENDDANGELDIRASLVDGSGAIASRFPIDTTVNEIDIEPAISNTNDASTWNIAWRRQHPAHGRIMAARLSWSGAIVAPTFEVPPGQSFPNYARSNPTCSGPIQGTSRYTIAWEESAGTDNDIGVAYMDGTTCLKSQLLPWTYEEESRPDIATNGSHFVCSYTRPACGSCDDDVVVAELEPVANDLVVREMLELGSATDDDITPRVVNHEESDPANFSTLYFVVSNRSTSGGGDIQMAAYVGFEGGPVEPFCTQSPTLGCPCGAAGTSSNGCPNSHHPLGAGLSATGNASTTNDTLTFQFTDLPPNSTALLFQSTNTSQVAFGDGVRCMSSLILRFPLRNANASGAAGYGSTYGDMPISVHGAVPLEGRVYNYQVWYRDSAAFCMPATTNFTNALKVTWTP